MLPPELQLEVRSHLPARATGKGNGNGPKPPLRFVHGGYCDSWCWEPHFLPWFAAQGYPSYALSLRGHPSPGAFIHQFTGDNRFIVDFLAEEVLSRQPGEIRQFLMRTAILARFCAPLCDAALPAMDSMN